VRTTAFHRDLGVALLSLAWATGAPAQQPGPSKAPVSVDVKESVLAEAPSGTHPKWLNAVPDHVGWAEAGHGQSVVRLDGKQVGEAYDDAKFVTLSVDGEHVAFIGSRKGEWGVVVDGVERTRHYKYLGPPAVDFAEGRVAVSACNGDHCHLLADTTEIGPEFEEISRPEMSPDQRHIFYAGKRNGKWVMVWDGQIRGPEMDAFCDCLFSPDNARLVGAGRAKGKWTWVIDTLAGPTYDQIGVVAFSPDGKHYAYGATNAESTGPLGIGKHKTHGFLVVDGSGEARGEGSGFGSAFAEFMGQYSEINRGLRGLTAAFNGVSDPIFSAEGKLVYASQRAPDAVALFIDSLAVGQYQNIISPVVTFGEGTQTYFVVRSDTTLTEMIDLRPGARIVSQSRAVIAVSGVRISHDGSHRAFEILRGGKGYQEGKSRRALRRVVMDGQAGPEYDALGISYLWFSNDGRHLAYVVGGADGDRDRMVLDGNEGRLYDLILPGSVRTTESGTITFVALDGNRFLRVTETEK